MRFVTGLCFAGIYVVAESWLNDRATKANRGRLRIERVAYTYNDVPVEVRHYNVQADNYCYFAPSQA